MADKDFVIETYRGPETERRDQQPRDFVIESYRSSAASDRNFAIESYRQTSEELPSRTTRYPTKVPYRMLNKAHDYAKEIRDYLKEQRRTIKVRPTVKEYDHVEMQVRNLQTGNLETINISIDKAMSKEAGIVVSRELFENCRSLQELRSVGQLDAMELRALSERGMSPQKEVERGAAASGPSRIDAQPASPQVESEITSRPDRSWMRERKAQLDASEQAHGKLSESLGSMKANMNHTYKVGNDKEWNVLCYDHGHGVEFVAYEKTNPQADRIETNNSSKLAGMMMGDNIQSARLIAAEPIGPVDGKLKDLADIIKGHTEQMPKLIQVDHLDKEVSSWKTLRNEHGKNDERLEYKLKGDNLTHTALFRNDGINRAERDRMIGGLKEHNPEVLSEFFKNMRDKSLQVDRGR
ncbi:hypothetical protein [Paenibacillus jiagnxiensis]|uniref:hypothetical protein n=1 Tax=Paenibacillus jiagnxiensis TaxID=3228926 RepID=UPI0033A17BE6